MIGKLLRVLREPARRLIAVIDADCPPPPEPARYRIGEHFPHDYGIVIVWPRELPIPMFNGEVGKRWMSVSGLTIMYMGSWQ